MVDSGHAQFAGSAISSSDDDGLQLQQPVGVLAQPFHVIIVTCTSLASRVAMQSDDDDMLPQRRPGQCSIHDICSTTEPRTISAGNHRPAVLEYRRKVGRRSKRHAAFGLYGVEQMTVADGRLVPDNQLRLSHEFGSHTAGRDVAR